MDTSTFMYIFGGIGLAIMVAVHLTKPKEIRGSVWETLTEGRTDTSRHSPEIVCPTARCRDTPRSGRSR